MLMKLYKHLKFKDLISYFFILFIDVSLMF